MMVGSININHALDFPTYTTNSLEVIFYDNQRTVHCAQGRADSHPATKLGVKST